MIDFSKSTALLGGSFDPIHEGHLHLATAVKRQCPGIDQIIFVPAAVSPGKPAPQASGADRLRWVEMAAAPYGFSAWDTELTRGGESFTVDTLTTAHGQGATRERLFWVMGADAYRSFSHWREPAEIRRLAQLIVVNRPGYSLTPQGAEDRILEISAHPASSTAIRGALAQGAREITYLPNEVRQDLSRLTLLGKNPYGKQ